MHCCLCGVNTNLHYPICSSCSDILEKYRLPESICPICGQIVWKDFKICPECRESSSPLSHFKSLFLYRGLICRLMQLYKFEGLYSLSRYFTEKIYTALSEDYQEYTLQVIPPRRGKIYRNGWDQMRMISSCLPWPQVSLLYRKNGITQKHLNKEERILNINGQFLCKKIHNPNIPILLLDDVHTTGATLKEAARVMKERGVHHVAALSIALD